MVFVLCLASVDSKKFPFEDFLLQLMKSYIHNSAEMTIGEQEDLNTFGSKLRQALLDLEKESCVHCWLNQRGRSNDGQHSYIHCPGLKGKCFKCLSTGHGSGGCPNKLKLKSGVCFGCILPRKIGVTTFHDKSMGASNCQSLGKDKIIPACWHAYHNCKSKLFSWAGLSSSGLSSSSSSEFAAWLSGLQMASDDGVSGGGDITNAVRTFMWYYEERSGMNQG
jgi:hypothetical protein